MTRYARAFLVAILLTAFAQGQQRYDSELREFEAFAAAEMKAQQMPGLSVAVMKGDFLWSKGFGWADVENRVPASAESSYRMASVTKPMTAVAVLELVEQGKIDLDAEVQKYVPDFPRKNYPITVRQLLAHQGGISHYKDYDVEGHFKDPKNTREALAVFKDFDLIAEPGTRYSYSSYGYNLLGAVIEGASGKPYGDFMREFVWKPLGMEATRMDDPRAVIPNRVRGYTLENGKLRNSEYVDISSRFAAGGTRSTVLDLIRFVQELEAGKVLDAKTRELMWTDVITRDGTAPRYALGWGVVPAAGRFEVSHGGSQQETRTHLLYIPRAQFAIALASNFEDANLNAFAERLALLFLGDSWNASLYVPAKADQSVLWALGVTWNNGLGYFDRYGKPRTAGRAELAEAFRYFNDAIQNADEKKIERGRHPAAKEAFIKVGSFMAAELARSGKNLEQYHVNGELSFFDDYNALTVPKEYRFSRTLQESVARWNRDWTRVWTADMKRMSALEGAERLRTIAPASSILPNYSDPLVVAAEEAAQHGDVAKAVRLSTLALEIYPEAEQANGISGVLALLGGDAARARTLLDKSHRLDANGYTSARNLLNIANFVARSDRRTAIALLDEALRLNPDSEDVKKKVAELKASDH
jgi:CubicO group peptidase (beta-lactamase class C family)